LISEASACSPRLPSATRIFHHLHHLPAEMEDMNWEAEMRVEPDWVKFGRFLLLVYRGLIFADEVSTDVGRLSRLELLDRFSAPVKW